MTEPRSDGRNQVRSEPHEEELRIFLERAVPRLPAPPGRLDGVRRRIARHRRRRGTAGAAAVAVAGIALAVTVLPGAGPGGRQGPASPSMTASASASASGTRSPGDRAPTPAPSSTPGFFLARFPQLSGLVLPLPGNWHTLAVPGDPQRKTAPTGLAETSRAPAPGLPLAVDGGLLTLSMPSGEGPAALHPVPPSKSCLLIRGTYEYEGLIVAPDDRTVIRAGLCLRGRAPRLVTDVRQALDGADFAPARDATP